MLSTSSLVQHHKICQNELQVVLIIVWKLMSMAINCWADYLSRSLRWSEKASSTEGISPFVLGTCCIRKRSNKKLEHRSSSWGEEMQVKSGPYNGSKLLRTMQYSQSTTWLRIVCIGTAMWSNHVLQHMMIHPRNDTGQSWVVITAAFSI
jgi:hypothetical protein